MSIGYQTARGASSDRLRKLLSGAPVRIVVLLIALVWTLPSAGPLVSSVAPGNRLTRTG